MEAAEMLVDFLKVKDLLPANAVKHKCGRWSDVLKPGDHVVVGRGKGPYHHSIYAGMRDGVYKMVEMNKEFNISYIPLSEMLGDYNKFYVVGFKNVDIDHDVYRAKTLQLATLLADDPYIVKNVKYNFLFSNCECFAFFCKTGKEFKSVQIEKIWRAIHRDLLSKNSKIGNVLAHSSRCFFQ